MQTKQILISGANSAIGSFLVQRYLADGYLVVALYHKNRNRLNILKRTYDSMLSLFACDLLDFDSTAKVIDEVTSSLKEFPNNFIHTVALRSSDFKPLAETSPTLWKEIIDVNIMSCYNLLHPILSLYKKYGGGRIVVLGSNVSRIGLKNGSAYSISKSAISNLVRTVGLEYSEFNILINCISPGPVNVDQSHFSEEYQQFRKDYFKKELPNIPIKRFVEPEELYKCCQFFISEQNSYITGEEIFLTGGKI